MKVQNSAKSKNDNTKVDPAIIILKKAEPKLNLMSQYQYDHNNTTFIVCGEAVIFRFMVANGVVSVSTIK